MEDTRFSSAIHMLILISEAEKPMSSEEIAVSVGTNSSHIRKIAGLLKKDGIIGSNQGSKGFSIRVDPKELSMFRIYKAVNETDHVRLFEIHRNPNDECIVGRHIGPVLNEMYSDMVSKVEAEMSSTTLYDCMQKMREKIREGIE
ncbi:MAG: Rrf2 family transcriptional regulator [Candidatus Methanomethylophilaceae archaeon]|nr:Rrf2 family transcriptional regulator [Candidatus Methanomethylophilaceae archaeon]